jgi:hypothetical protein
MQSFDFKRKNVFSAFLVLLKKIIKKKQKNLSIQFKSVLFCRKLKVGIRKISSCEDGNCVDGFKLFTYFGINIF